MRDGFIVCLAALSFLFSGAMAQTCPFVVVHDAGTITVACDPVSGQADTWDLILSVGPSPAVVNIDVVVQRTGAGNRPSIRQFKVMLDSSATNEVWANVTISGPAGDEDSLLSLGSTSFEGLGSLRMGLNVELLRTFGDIGFILAHDVDTVLVGGNMTAGVFLADPWLSLQWPTIDIVEIGGSLLGNIWPTLGGNIDRVIVVGDIGTPSFPVYIGSPIPGTATDIDIGTVECSNYYGTLYTGTGTLRRLSVTGDFTGIVETFGGITVAQSLGSGDPGLFVQGHIDGSLFVDSQNDGSLLVSQEFSPTSSILIPELIVGESLVFEDDVFGTVEINTNLDGELIILGEVSDKEIVVGQDVSATGNVEIGSITGAGFRIDRDLDGTFTIADTFAGYLSIGRDLSGSALFETSNSLAGQIVVNSESLGGSWSGDVTIGTGTGSIVLGPGEAQPYQAPYYHALSSELGGGAVGLVPFQFHEKESNPVHNSVVSTTPPSQAVIEHYGPLTDDGDSETTLVRVFRAGTALPLGYSSHADVPLCFTSGAQQVPFWTEVTSNFSLTIDSNTSRQVIVAGTLAGGFQKGHAYQIIASGLACDFPHTLLEDVLYTEDWAWTGAWNGTAWCTGSPYPDLPESRGYGFIIPSALDLNSNLMHDPGDIEAWLYQPEDVNEDESVDSLDLIEIIEAVSSEE